MTALDNAVSTTSNKASLAKNERTSNRNNRSKLSLRGQKRTLSSDISVAPEPRTSNRIRTTSASENDERSKSSQSTSKKGTNQSSNSGSQPSPVKKSQGSQGSLGGGMEASNVALPTTGGGRVGGVCPLSNMGNTCFLNSVLYALRFLPGFTHDLHHLHTHLQSTKHDCDSSLEQRMQFLSELHSVFVHLSQEEKNNGDNKRIPAFQPHQFLDALRVVNPMFEGNRQQDAHELLHCLLDQLCHLPQDLKNKGNGITKDEDLGPPDAKRARRRSERIQALEEDSSKLSPKAVDVVGSKFVGRMCLETCCSECEKVTGREETFLEVCVPVKTKADFDDDDDITEPDVFMSALCEEECLRDNNKYWCDQCCHHNEARRSVHYPELPYHLLIHVKRFSSYSRNMFTAKCSEAMPAPLQLPCFCRSCRAEKLIQKQKAAEGGTSRLRNVHKGKSEPLQPHLPYNLTAVVCHLGATLSSGHYMSFVRVSPHPAMCPEYNSQSSFSSSSPNSSKSQQSSQNSNSSTSSSPESKSPHECSWPNCCAMRIIDSLLPQVAVNGHPESSSKESYPSNLWLECDDEKIKLVTSADVSDMMRATLITPYLLFYSRF